MEEILEEERLQDVQEIDKDMEQKRVTFEVAKALKEAGYPQIGDYWYSDNGGLSDDWIPEMMYCAAPLVTDVWLWLWREKGISIDIEHLIGNDFANFVLGRRILTNGQYQTDPEEAIEAAIKYIVDNGLLK